MWNIVKSSTRQFQNLQISTMTWHDMNKYFCHGLFDELGARQARIRSGAFGQNTLRGLRLEYTSQMRIWGLQKILLTYPPTQRFQVAVKGFGCLISDLICIRWVGQFSWHRLCFSKNAAEIHWVDFDIPYKCEPMRKLHSSFGKSTLILRNCICQTTVGFHNLLLWLAWRKQQ